MGSSKGLHGFRTLYAASKISSFVVVIPGVGTPSPETWGKSSGEPWLKTLLLNAAPNTEILTFDNGLSSDDTFSWQRLVESGADLLDTLLRLRDDEKVQEFPLLFLCHSLGGIILKQALCLAQQDLSRFRGLFTVVAGLVLMGTPHSKSEDEASWRNVSLIPRASLKKFSKLPLSRDEMGMLGSISRQFEAIEPPIPLLSTYETRSTRIRSGGMGILSIKSTLREFSITHLRHEENLEVDADRNNLCDFGRRSDAYHRISTFINDAIEATQRGLFLNPNSSTSSLYSDTDEFSDSYSESQASRGVSPKQRRDRSVHAPESSAPRGRKSQHTKASRATTFEIISQASEFSQRDPRLPCFIHKNHTRNPDFFGRRDVLRRIEEALLPQTHVEKLAVKTLKTFGLCGLGGIGKTEVAVEFMFAHRHDYDAVFWVQADEKTKLADGFCNIALELGLEEEGKSQNQGVSRELVMEWLCRPFRHCRRPKMSDENEYASWLLILDNVDDPSILKDYWPSEGKGSILLTSRDPLARTRAFRINSGVTLQPFDEHGAAKFLVGLTDNDVENEDDDEDDFEHVTRGTNDGQIPVEAVTIAKRLGGLPLALALMAGIISRRYLSYDEFLSMYDHEQGLKELHALDLGMQDTGYQHTLASVWALDRLGKGAALLLDLMSLMDPDRIQEDVLTSGASKIMIDRFPKDASEYLAARAELTKSSLIARNRNQNIIKVHRLTQDGVRAAMSNETLQQMFTAAVTLISEVWPFVTIDKRHNTSRWEKCEALFPHVLRLKNTYLASIRPKALFVPGLDFAKLLNDVGWYFYERSIPENCEPFFQVAQIVCESQDQVYIDLLSDINYSRGADASEVNDPKRCMEQTSRFWKLRIQYAETSPLGRRDLRLAMSYNQMGVAYMMLRDYESAVGVLERAFEIYDGLENKSPVLATLPAANMGLALWFLGRHEEAYKVLLDMLRKREKAFGVNDNESFKTGRILHALGNVRASQGRLKDSFDFHQRALLQYRSTIGDNHHRTADVCYKVSEHYIRFWKHEEAKKLLEQALKVFTSKSHYNHEKVRTQYLMGRLMALMKDEAMSEKFFREAFNGWKLLNPGDARARDELTDIDFEDLACFWAC